MSDLPFLTPAPDPTRPARDPRKCGRHYWAQVYHDDVPQCTRCGRFKDAAVSRRGRNNRSRGTRDELAVARLLGGAKVGELGLAWDVEVPGYLRVQCKRLDRWPSVAKVLEWVDAIPVGPAMRAVTLADTPGPGGRTRRLIVLDLGEFAEHHGRASE